MTSIAARIERELAVRSRLLWTEVRLARARRTAEPVLAGPFLGEVGYELLYWIPFLRRLLARHRIDPARVTVLTRGGAAAWYSDFAGGAVDLFDLVPAADYLQRLAARRVRAADAKQLRVDRFDLELVELARARVGPALVVHPCAMYGRLRWLWFGRQRLARAARRIDVRRLAAPPRPDGLPPRYTALKAYFSECFPDGPAGRAWLRDAVATLAASGDVVLLTTGLAVDDHEEWSTSERVHRIDRLLRPETNLAVQTAVVAHADRLVSTYGGFSYLGPLLGVPTVAFRAHENSQPIHLEVLRASFPDADYSVVATGDPPPVALAQPPRASPTSARNASGAGS